MTLMREEPMFIFCTKDIKEMYGFPDKSKPKYCICTKNYTKILFLQELRIVMC